MYGHIKRGRVCECETVGGLGTNRAQGFPLVVNVNKAVIHLIIARSVN